jgi:hypothetical protein
MSDTRPDESLLAAFFASVLNRKQEESYSALRDAARDLAIAVHTDSAAWSAVNVTLRQIAAENAVDAILARQSSAMAGISNSFRLSNWRILDAPDRLSEKEMQEAEADLRDHIPDITSKLSEIEERAKEISADPEKRTAIQRISDVANAHLSQLSPFAVVIVLWWLLASLPSTDLGILTVWYMIVSDYLKKYRE